MELYKNQGGKLVSISTSNFKVERELQKLVEENLNHLFNLTLIQSEFPSVTKEGRKRFDSLCFDEDNNSFVIIEYKNKEKGSVIDQGFTYLSRLLNNKPVFLHRLGEHFDRHVKENEIDWSSSKVIFISPKFTSYQKESINFKDLPFELFEVVRFEGGLVGFSQIEVDSNESITNDGKSFEQNGLISQVTREVKVYSEQKHLDYTTEEISEIYEEIKERVFEIGDDIKIVPRKEYIGFKTKSNFLDVEFQKKQLKLFLNMKEGELEDPMEVSRDVSKVGHYGNGDYEVKVNQTTDLDYLLFLIRQSYNSKLIKEVKKPLKKK